MRIITTLLCMIVSVMAFAQTTNIKYQIDGIGTTPGDGKGIWFINTTPALVGAQQQYSPSIVLEGQGWQTTTPASQSVKFMEDVVPVTGLANPSGTWRLRSSINNGAYSTVPIVQANSDGTVLIGGSTITSNTRLDVRGTGTGTELAFRIANLPNTSRWQITNQGHVTQNAQLGGHSLTATYTAFSDNLSINALNGTVNMRSNSGDIFTQEFNQAGITTNGTNQTLREYASTGTWTVNHTGATIFGYDYNPTIAGSQTPTHLAWRNTSGNMLIGGTTLSSASALVDMQSTTKGVVVPRVTNIASITTPVNGMVAYDATTNLFNFRQNGAWVTLSGGTPGGSAGDIQYNNSGTFGGFGDYNSGADRVTATGMIRSEGTYIPFQALGASSSYQGVVNWQTGFINTFGSSTQAVNIFQDDAGALSDRSAIVEYNILLTKPDGSDVCVKKILVAYQKDGAAAPTIVTGTPSVILAVGNSTPTVTFNVLTFPQINISSNGSGDWNIKVWANVSMSN